MKVEGLLVQCCLRLVAIWGLKFAVKTEQRRCGCACAFLYVFICSKQGVWPCFSGVIVTLFLIPFGVAFVFPFQNFFKKCVHWKIVFWWTVEVKGVSRRWLVEECISHAVPHPLNITVTKPVFHSIAAQPVLSFHILWCGSSHLGWVLHWWDLFAGVSLMFSQPPSS